MIMVFDIFDKLTYSPQTVWVDLPFIYMVMHKWIVRGFIIYLVYNLFFYMHPIKPLLSVIFVCVLILIYLFTLNVHFLGVVFAIIYIGAILILFLFVIMLFRKVYAFYYKTFLTTEWIILVIFLFFYISQISTQLVLWAVNPCSLLQQNLNILSVSVNSTDRNMLVNYLEEHKLVVFQEYKLLIDTQHTTLTPSTLIQSNIEVFVNELYTYYGIVFLISGVILLISMIGAITIIFLVKNTDAQVDQFDCTLVDSSRLVDLQLIQNNFLWSYIKMIWVVVTNFIKNFNLK